MIGSESLKISKVDCLPIIELILIAGLIATVVAFSPIPVLIILGILLVSGLLLWAPIKWAVLLVLSFPIYQALLGYMRITYYDFSTGLILEGVGVAWLLVIVIVKCTLPVAIAPRRITLIASGLNRFVALFGLLFIFALVVGFVSGNSIRWILGDSFKNLQFLFMYCVTLLFLDERIISWIIAKLTKLAIFVAFVSILIQMILLQSKLLAADSTHLLSTAIGSMMFLPFILSALLLQKQNSQKYYLGLLILAANIVISLSRGIWLGSLLGIIAVTWLIGLKRGQFIQLRRVVLRLGYSALVMGSVMLFLYIMFPYFTEYVFSTVSARIDSAKVGDPSILARFEQISLVLSSWQESPLWGKGMGGTFEVSRYLARLVPNVTGHFIDVPWLDILLRMGLIGVVMVLMMYSRLFIFIIRTTPQKSAADEILFGIFGFFASFLVVNLFQNGVAAVGGFMLASAIKLSKTEKRQ